MTPLKKILLIACIGIMLGHFYTFFSKNGSLFTFVTGNVAMVFTIFGILIAKKEQN